MRLVSLWTLCLITIFASAEASIPPYHRPEALKDTYPLLFGTQEVSYDNLAAFPKWINVMARASAEINLDCPQTFDGQPCKVTQWKKYIQSIQGRSLKEQLVLINNYVNSEPYRPDSSIGSSSDYWQTPGEFFATGGDCEDFAIAKFLSLKLLGIPQSAMRIVVLNDLRLRTIHAVLSVYVDGETYILDNQIKKVVPMSMVSYYQPIYSINEQHWWRHKA